jgi:hypothetical protein
MENNVSVNGIKNNHREDVCCIYFKLKLKAFGTITI